MVQGWVWRELEQYKTRICDIGVDGHALYDLEGLSGLHPTHSCPHTSKACRTSILVSNCATIRPLQRFHTEAALPLAILTLFSATDDVLEQDIRMQYRLHRKLFLDAVVKLQVI